MAANSVIRGDLQRACGQAGIRLQIQGKLSLLEGVKLLDVKK